MPSPKSKSKSMPPPKDGTLRPSADKLRRDTVTIPIFMQVTTPVLKQISRHVE